MTAVELATKHGATFEQRPDKVWVAICKRRGRPVPLVTFLSETKEGAAQMYLQYFHVKER